MSSVKTKLKNSRAFDAITPERARIIICACAGRWIANYVAARCQRLCKAVHLGSQRLLINFKQNIEAHMQNSLRQWAPQKKETTWKLLRTCSGIFLSSLHRSVKRLIYYIKKDGPFFLLMVDYTVDRCQIRLHRSKSFFAGGFCDAHSLASSLIGLATACSRRFKTHICSSTASSSWRVTCHVLIKKGSLMSTGEWSRHSV